MNTNHVYKITVTMCGRDYPRTVCGRDAEREYNETVRKYRGNRVKLYDMTEGRTVKEN